jgi:hypothetical protein
VKKLKSLVKATQKTLVQVLKCSVSYWIKVKLVITLVFYFVEQSVKMLNVVKFWLSLVQLRHIQNFEAEAYILTKEEGGRHTPFFKNYRPQFYFRTTDVTGKLNCQLGKEMVMPGDNTKITVKMISPVAMDPGLRFAIREGGRTVGSGVVSKVIK